MSLDLDGIWFSYKGGPDILHDINVAFNEPGLICIIGPNGVGKSTLVRCMNKILKPTKGVVTLDGEDISSLKYKDLAKHMGYVPVGTDDTFPMTVFDTVMMGRAPKRGWVPSNKDQELAYSVLELLGIEDLAMRNFNELSAGQHQKVAIATPADAALMMQLGAEGVFVGSGIFRSGDPAKRAKAIVQAVTNYTDSKLLAEVSTDLGQAMVGINAEEIKTIMAERGQ